MCVGEQQKFQVAPPVPAAAGAAAAPSKTSVEAATAALTVVAAFTGERCCEVLANPAWSVRRLKAEIDALQTSPGHVHALVSGTNLLSDDDAVQALFDHDGEKKSGCDDPTGTPVTLSLLRLPLLRVPPCSGQELLQVESGGAVSEMVWRVGSWRLRSRDRTIVSQPFTLQLGAACPPASFRLALQPKLGCSSFKQSSGRGSCEIKCVSRVTEDVGAVRLRLWIGEGESLQGPFGPCEHDFHRNALGCWPRSRHGADIDFGAAAKKNMTFPIGIEIIHTRWDGVPGSDILQRSFKASPAHA